MTPNAAPLDRAAIAREATLQLVNEFTDGTLPDVFRLTPAQRARMLGYIDGEYPAPSPTPPPIPLGAVVTVTVNGVEWQREDGEWDDAEGGGPPNKADALDFLDRIAELEREVHLARNDEALALSTSREWESYCKRAERERDEARRELAELQVVARGMVESARGEAVDLGSFTSPAPASAPRRWWLVVDRDGYPVYAYSSERLAVEQAQEDNENVPRPAFTPYSVVPVIEARVTRETVERVEGIVRKARGTNRTSEHWAYEIVRALGLTVEE